MNFGGAGGLQKKPMICINLQLYEKMSIKKYIEAKRKFVFS
jgi:hypothetical protein